MKYVQIRSFFCSVFSCIRTKSPYSFRMHENTDQKKLLIWTLFTQCHSSCLLYTRPDHQTHFLLLALNNFFLNFGFYLPIYHSFLIFLFFETNQPLFENFKFFFSIILFFNIQHLIIRTITYK